VKPIGELCRSNERTEDHVHNAIATVLVLGTPAFALTAAILASILRVRGEHRLLELAQRERLAAIEKGIDVKDWPLPALPGRSIQSMRELSLRRAQGLTIGGILSIGLGLGLAVMLRLMQWGDGGDAWPIGILPLFLGLALLLSARIVRKDLDSSD
jgi:hypothetical protein